ncbi:hypothetical protein BDY19DRAFT_901446 [Irpex rosettiformis]|uniref:Uncharacterized protein n=1 Tax=Irpex rosettiformis TaxID=378272 RepID=A0ACB8UIR4_9APHY|nr:hypothetical protein BDY19DRAFT_901446 [Irpex rosettiformis]
MTLSAADLWASRPSSSAASGADREPTRIDDYQGVEGTASTAKDTTRVAVDRPKSNTPGSVSQKDGHSDGDHRPRGPVAKETLSPTHESIIRVQRAPIVDNIRKPNSNPSLYTQLTAQEGRGSSGGIHERDVTNNKIFSTAMISHDNSGRGPAVFSPTGQATSQKGSCTVAQLSDVRLPPLRLDGSSKKTSVPLPGFSRLFGSASGQGLGPFLQAPNNFMTTIPRPSLDAGSHRLPLPPSSPTKRNVAFTASSIGLSNAATHPHHQSPPLDRQQPVFIPELPSRISSGSNSDRRSTVSGNNRENRIDRNHSAARGHQEEENRDSDMSGVGAGGASSDIPDDPTHANAGELQVPPNFNGNLGDWLKTQLRSFRQEEAALEHAVEDAKARAQHLFSLATESEKELEKVHGLIARMKKDLKELSPDEVASSDEEEIGDGARHEHHAPIRGRSQAPSPRNVSPAPKNGSPSPARTPRAPTTFRLVPARFTPPPSDIQGKSRAPTPIAQQAARSLSPFSLASGVAPPFPAASNALGLVLGAGAEVEQPSRPTPEHDNGDVQRRDDDYDRQTRDVSEDDQRRSPSSGDENVRSRNRERGDVEDSPLERRPTPFSPVSSSFVPVSYNPMWRVNGNGESQVGQKRRWENAWNYVNVDEDVEMDIESGGDGRLAKRTRSNEPSRSGSGNGHSEHIQDGHAEGLENNEDGESISCSSSQSSWIESQVARMELPPGQKIHKRTRPQAAAETRVARRVLRPRPQYARRGLSVGCPPIARPQQPEEQIRNVPMPGVPFKRVLDRSQSVTKFNPGFSTPTFTFTGNGQDTVEVYDSISHSDPIVYRKPMPYNPTTVTRTPTPSRPHTRSQTRLRNQPQAVLKKKKIPIPREALRQLHARAQARMKPKAQPQSVTAQNERNNVDVDEPHSEQLAPERSRPTTRSRTRAQAATQPQAATQVAAPEPQPAQRLRRTAPRPALPLPRTRRVATLNANAQAGGSGLTAEEKEKIAGHSRRVKDADEE